MLRLHVPKMSDGRIFKHTSSERNCSAADLSSTSPSSRVSAAPVEQALHKPGPSLHPAETMRKSSRF